MVFVWGKIAIIVCYMDYHLGSIQKGHSTLQVKFLLGLQEYERITGEDCVSFHC